VRFRYKYRLYPARGQRQALARAFGCARVVFNDALRARQDAYEAGLPYITDGELSARLTAAKATPERAWLAAVSAVVLQQSLADLNAAYRNFFASATGKRKGPKIGPPRFKSRKDHRQAVRFTANARFSITAGGKLHLPKIGDVPIRWSRDLPAQPSSVTVIKDAAGRYFASFVVETAGDPLRRFARIGRFEPTSQVCSACGVKDGPKPLGVREWACGACGTVHDRDVNAARNILAAGRADSQNACGGDIRPGAPLAVAGETGSLRGAASYGTG
jgi:transposase